MFNWQRLLELLLPFLAYYIILLTFFFNKERIDLFLIKTFSTNIYQVKLALMSALTVLYTQWAASDQFSNKYNANIVSTFPFCNSMYLLPLFLNCFQHIHTQSFTFIMVQKDCHDFRNTLFSYIFYRLL